MSDIQEKQIIVRAKRETTYGSSSSPGNDDTVYCEGAGAIEDDRAVIEREGHNARAGGWPPALGAKRVILPPLKTELVPVRLNTGGAPSERPLCDPWLAAVGLQVGTPSAGSLPYALKDFGLESICLEVYQARASGAAYIKREVLGVRGGGKIVFKGDDRLMLEMNLGAKTLARSAQGSALTPNYKDNASTPKMRAPFMGYGVTCTSAIRGGSPSFTGGFTALEIDLGRAPDLQFDAGQAGGIREAVVDPMPVKVKFRVHAEALATFNWWTYRDSREIMETTWAFTDSGGAADTLTIAMHWSIDKITRAFENKREVLDIEGTGVWTSDGTPGDVLTLTWGSA